MSGSAPWDSEPDGWQEERERQDFEDSPGNLSEALGRARAGEMGWEEIQRFALRAERAASACSSLAGAFAAEVMRLDSDGKIPAGSDVYYRAPLTKVQEAEYKQIWKPET